MRKGTPSPETLVRFTLNGVEKWKIGGMEAACATELERCEIF